jgi:hypothetical protein
MRLASFLAENVVRSDMAAVACIFCRIVAGAGPCVELYRDRTTLAFMDIHPVNEGHCLVRRFLETDQIKASAPHPTLSPQAGRGSETQRSLLHLCRYGRALPLPVLFTPELGFTRVRQFKVAEVGYIRLRLRGWGEGLLPHMIRILETLV